ncbi:putative tetracycline efflux protein [Xylariales sp. PMI_506]|nr:putative tetracycline efflux protein [Xylariales sp. PMI_506]
MAQPSTATDRAGLEADQTFSETRRSSTIEQDSTIRPSNAARELEAEGLDPELPSDEKTKLQDQTNLLPFKQLIVVFLGLSCALFCDVSTALPTLGRVFNDASISSWVGTAYLLTSTSCQPLYGRLSDIFGRKVVLLASMGFFLVGSILCAVSRSMIMLIVFRAISGIGGGGILTSVMIVTSDVVSLEKRGTYQGILGVVVALANSLGPLVGGAFSEAVSWRWCFYINIPLTSIAILVVTFVLPLKRVKGDVKSKLAKIDYLGCAIMVSSALLILLPLSWGGTQYPWDSAGVLVPLILGIVLFGAFIFVEMKIAGLPLIPMAGANGGAFFTGFMFYCNLYYLPQFYQVVHGASPIESGVLLLPLTLSQTIVSFTAGALVSKTGNYQLNLWVGFAIWTIACGLLSTVSPTISNAKLVGYQILSGVGAGQTFQTSLIAIQASVKRSEMAVATGTRNFVRLLGGTVALAACAAILNNTVKNELAATISSDIIDRIISDPTKILGHALHLTPAEKTAAILAYTHGIRNIYYLMIPCCGISFFLTLFFVKGHSLRRDDDAQRQKEGKEWAAKHRGIINRRRGSQSRRVCKTTKQLARRGKRKETVDGNLGVPKIRCI